MMIDPFLIFAAAMGGAAFAIFAMNYHLANYLKERRITTFATMRRLVRNNKIVYGCEVCRFGPSKVVFRIWLNGTAINHIQVEGEGAVRFKVLDAKGKEVDPGVEIHGGKTDWPADAPVGKPN